MSANDRLLLNVADMSPELQAELAGVIRLCLDEKEFDWDLGFPYRCNRDLGHRGDHWVTNPRNTKSFVSGFSGVRWRKKRVKT